MTVSQARRAHRPMPRKVPDPAARTRARKPRAWLWAGTSRAVKTRQEPHCGRADHSVLPPPCAAPQRANRRAERRISLVKRYAAQTTVRDEAR